MKLAIFRPYFFIAAVCATLCFFSACSKPDSEKPGKDSASFKADHPVRGPGKNALSIEQFSDFYCTYCKQQARILKKVIEAYPDKIRWTFRHLPISGEPGTGSFPVHEASMCAAEQGKFWEFHDAVFLLDKNAELNELVQTVHLDQPRFDACFNSNRYRDFIMKDIEEAKSRRVAGTPTFFINGESISGLRSFDYFAEKVDPVFAEKAAAQRKQMQDDFLSKIDTSEKGRPSAGLDNAPVTITEFSDFHCPFCIRLTETLKKIMEAYPQDVRRVWRHFPLPIHPYSPYAHLAAECAHSQGKFWDFHHKIFTDPKESHSEKDLALIAESLQLDGAGFKACFESAQTKKKIENDVLFGMYKKVGSTPTFFVNDEMFVGAKSFEDLKAIVERKLNETKNPGLKPVKRSEE